MPLVALRTIALAVFPRALGLGLALAVGASAPAAWAAQTGPDVTFTIDATDAATLSRESPRLDSRTGYLVRLANSSGQVINEVSFRASTAVSPSGSPAATLDTSVLPPGCGAGSTANAVTCSFGQLRPGQGVTFTLVFNTPTAGDEVALTGIATYKEGPKDRNGNPPRNDTRTLVVATRLLPADAVAAATYISPVGGTLFTGAVVTNLADTWSTRIVVPSASRVIGVKLFEDVQDESCSPSFSKCVRSSIRADGVFPAPGYLTVYLRLDATLIASYANLANFGLNYTPGTLTFDVATGQYAFTPTAASFPLLDCSVLPNGVPQAGAVAEDQKRCIQSRRKLLTADGPDAFGDVLFEIRLTENGRVSLR